MSILLPAGRERAVLDAVPSRLFIGGRWVDALTRGAMDVSDPATGETLTQVADATQPDAMAALAAADEAGAAFRRTAPRERADMLRRAYELMLERADDLALVATLEMGKPLAEAKDEVVYAADYLRWYAEEAVRINGRFTTHENGGGRVLTVRRPVGTCLFITPWNFPLAMVTRKVGPAIAAGCTCVLKPAPQTPLSSLLAAQILAAAGVPAGVVNVVPSSRSGEIVEPMMQDARLRKLSFTGSTAVGRVLVRQSADQLLRVSMELGGNAPFLVFEDADLDAAVEGAVTAKMRNGGEACTSANRIYAHESVADEFAARLAERIGAMRVGRGTDPDVEVGPLVDRRQVEKVTELVGDAVGRGASVLCGGAPIEGPGYFYAPTVLSGVAPDARLLSEEIFGPVAPVLTFRDEEEAVALANATEFGLVAYAFTRDLNRGLRLGQILETGMIGLNQGFVSNVGAPFGGVKHSGFGREGGPEGLEAYLETTYIAISGDA